MNNDALMRMCLTSYVARVSEPPPSPDETSEFVDTMMSLNAVTITPLDRREGIAESTPVYAYRVDFRDDADVSMIVFLSNDVDPPMWAMISVDYEPYEHIYM